MNLAVVQSRATVGIRAPSVIIEVHLSKGLPGLSIVGLPETAVKESRHRVRSAIINSGFEFPVRRITVNLAPADLPKEGGRFDLPIALGILAASEQIPASQLAEYEIIGELALSGEVRSCQGILPVAIAAYQAGKNLILPQGNIPESLLVKGLTARGGAHLSSVCAHFRGNPLPESEKILSSHLREENTLDLAQVQGQAHGRRALEIAAAGGHSLLMVGSPGSGKTMLASRLPSILPPMTEQEALEVASIYSISRLGFNYDQWQQRPFRNPHHTASSIALVGGGSPLQPGEISLAHQGVLFLDELPEFNRSALEALREPLEAGHISLSRACHQAVFPARFQLVAAMNPCPCGYWGDNKGRCRCTSEQIHRYQNKISGPLLDRIDMHLAVQPLDLSTLIQPSLCNESSADIRLRVCQAREIQWERQKKCNADLEGEKLQKYCRINQKNQKFLTKLIESFGLSARGYYRILRMARTIADLRQMADIDQLCLYEASSYRGLGFML